MHSYPPTNQFVSLRFFLGFIPVLILPLVADLVAVCSADQCNDISNRLGFLHSISQCCQTLSAGEWYVAKPHAGTSFLLNFYPNYLSLSTTISMEFRFKL